MSKKSFTLNKFAAVFCIVSFFAVAGCATEPGFAEPAITLSESAPLKVVSWNVQTFFDAVESGNEYSEFTGSKTKWSQEKYKARLERLCDFIRKEDAGIFCFMEIENTDVVQDISNYLAGSSVSGTKWHYVYFSRDENSSLGCAVFSKYEAKSFYTHKIDYRAALCSPRYEGYPAGSTLKPPAMRPLLELHFDAKYFEDGEKSCDLALFVCHWKSKSGGEAKSNIWRGYQEALLAGRVDAALSSESAVLVCGDFNRDLDEFSCLPEFNSVELRQLGVTADNAANMPVILESPWFESGIEGSYYYKKNWSRIDHFFIAGGLCAEKFCVINDSELTDSEGVPKKYKVWSGSGYSDHLPLCAYFFIRRKKS